MKRRGLILLRVFYKSENREYLILYGPKGTGKTHMAAAIGVEACNQRKKGGFYRTSNVVNELNDAQNTRNLGKMLKQLAKLDVLICDECGYILLDRQGAQLLFQVVADCYKTAALLLHPGIQ